MSSPGDKKKIRTPEEIWQLLIECVAQFTRSTKAFITEKQFNTQKLQRFHDLQVPLTEQTNTLLKQYVDSGDKKHTKEIINISKCRKDFYEFIINELFKLFKTQINSKEKFHTLSLLEDVIENDILNEKVITPLVKNGSSITLNAIHFRQQLIHTYYQEAEAYWTLYTAPKTKETSSLAIKFAEHVISILKKDQHDPDFSKATLFNTSVLLYKIHLELENHDEQQKYAHIISELSSNTILWEIKTRYYCRKNNFEAAREYLNNFSVSGADKTPLETLAINALYVHFLSAQCRLSRENNPIDEITAPIFEGWIQEVLPKMRGGYASIKKCDTNDPLAAQYFSLLMESTTPLEILLFEINKRVFLQERKFLTLLIKFEDVLIELQKTQWKFSKNKCLNDAKTLFFTLVEAHLCFISSNYGLCQIALLAHERNESALLTDKKTINCVRELLTKRLVKLFSDIPTVNDTLLALSHHDFLILGNLLYLQELLNGHPNKKFQRQLAKAESAMLRNPETLRQLIHCYRKLAVHIEKHNPRSLEAISFNFRALKLIEISQAKSKTSPEFTTSFNKYGAISSTKKAIENDIRTSSHNNASEIIRGLFAKKKVVEIAKSYLESRPTLVTIICKIINCVHDDEITKAKSHLNTLNKNALAFREDEQTLLHFKKVYQNYIFIGEISLFLKRKVKSLNGRQLFFKTNHLRETFHKKLVTATSTLEENFNAVCEYSANDDAELLLIQLFTNAHYLAHIIVAIQLLESTFETEKLKESEKGLLLIHRIVNYAIHHPKSSDDTPQEKEYELDCKFQQWEYDLRLNSLINLLVFHELQTIQQITKKTLGAIANNSQQEKTSTQSTLKAKPKKKRQKKKNNPPKKLKSTTTKTIEKTTEASRKPKVKIEQAPKTKEKSTKKNSQQQPKSTSTVTSRPSTKLKVKTKPILKTKSNPKPRPNKKRPGNRKKNGHTDKRNGTTFTISFPPTLITQANKTVTKATQPNTATAILVEPTAESASNTRDKAKLTKRPTFKRSNSAEIILGSKTRFYWSRCPGKFNPRNAYDSKERLFEEAMKTKYYPKKDDTTEDTPSEEKAICNNVSQ